ncbi:MAG: FAD-dependent oxidoreductase, partial [Acidobacteria bacterium]|nr:FAD-dependent oxidoreductase [Acidobacteriota bacterium]
MGETIPHVVIIGAGFGGLTTAQSLKRAPVRITLIDRTNHHLFQPLLYQVAMAGLSPAEIAAPIRSILRKQKNVTVLLDEAVDVNFSERIVCLRDSTLNYDYLVLATGGRTSYFGHDEWEIFAPGLKDLDDAVEIRRRVLMAFEAAEKETDPERRRELMTFVVVGGGPTGVELAGAIAELARFVLAR